MFAAELYVMVSLYLNSLQGDFFQLISLLGDLFLTELSTGDLFAAKLSTWWFLCS